MILQMSEAVKGMTNEICVVRDESRYLDVVYCLLSRLMRKVEVVVSDGEKTWFLCDVFMKPRTPASRILHWKFGYVIITKQLVVRAIKQQYTPPPRF